VREYVCACVRERENGKQNPKDACTNNNTTANNYNNNKILIPA